VLFPSRDDDPPAYVGWQDRALHVVPGGQALVDVTDDAIYMAMNLRNVGAGIAVLHGWYPCPAAAGASATPQPAEKFRRLSRDLFVPPEDSGFWQGAIREPDDPDRAWVAAAAAVGERILIDLLYGDLEGGQRTISRFSMGRRDDIWRADVVRHWHIDRPDPR
jgi:hypothetical protein